MKRGKELILSLLKALSTRLFIGVQNWLMVLTSIIPLKSSHYEL